MELKTLVENEEGGKKNYCTKNYICQSYINKIWRISKLKWEIHVSHILDIQRILKT